MMNSLQQNMLMEAYMEGQGKKKLRKYEAWDTEKEETAKDGLYMIRGTVRECKMWMRKRDVDRLKEKKNIFAITDNICYQTFILADIKSNQLNSLFLLFSKITQYFNRNNATCTKKKFPQYCMSFKTEFKR